MNAAGLLHHLRLRSLTCIGARAPHNAFCDLVHWHNRMWLVYREGAAHVSPDGVVRVLSSSDGASWQEAAVLRQDGEDLRDPKLCVTPDGRLMLNTSAVVRDDQRHLLQLRNLAWYSSDGTDWGAAHEVAERGIWLWRVTWHGDIAYGVGYSCIVPGAPQRFVRFYRSDDGLDFTTHVDTLVEGGYPNEHALLFLPDGDALCLLRCDDERKSALLGRAQAPYHNWSWHPIGCEIGGPQMILLPGGDIAVGGRIADGSLRTAICSLDVEQGNLTEIVALKSGGDTGYPGMLWRERSLWIAYYSAHEGPCRVYLARFGLDS